MKKKKVEEKDERSNDKRDHHFILESNTLVLTLLFKNVFLRMYKVVRFE